jgi:ADP-ribosylglycohydrolase/Leucine-rich repeat (LRR) protein
VTRNALVAADLNGLLSLTPSLEHLDASFNPLQKFPAAVSGCPQLKVLDLRVCSFREVPWADVTSTLTDLRVLRLDGNQITDVDASLFALPKLTGVSLEGNPIPDVPAPDAAGSPLRALNIGRLHLKSLSPELFSKFADTLVSLDIQCSNLSEFPTAVLSLRRIERLNISGTTLTQVPAEISALAPTLRQLVLRFNNLTEMPPGIADLDGLRLLDLAGNGLSSLAFRDSADEELSFSAWSNFTSLESLSVAYNDLRSGADVGASELLDLCKSHALRYICFDGNGFVGDENPLLRLRGGPLEHAEKKPEKMEQTADELAAARALRLVMEHEPAEVFLATLVGGRSGPAFDANNSADDASDANDSTDSPAQASNVHDAILGCIFGCALGDAVGLSTEFIERYQAYIYYHAARPLWQPWDSADSDLFDDADAVVTNAQRELDSGCEWLLDRHRQRWIRGDMTDDTDQLLLILDGIVDTCDGKGVDTAGFVRQLYNWASNGFSELGDQGGMGIGSTVGAVLRHEDFLPPLPGDDSSNYHPHRAAREVWEQQNRNAAANGSVMRTAVCGIPQFWDAEAVCDNTRQIAAVTHVDPRAMASCFTTTYLVAAMLRNLTGGGDPDEPLETLIQRAVESAIDNCQDGDDQSAIALEGDNLDQFRWHSAPDRTLRELDLTSTKGMGYCLKALGSALWTLRQPNGDFAHAIQKLLMEAGDADTNGAVAGALLGTRVGFHNLPQFWIDQLPHRDMLRARAEKLSAAVIASTR